MRPGARGSRSSAPISCSIRVRPTGSRRRRNQISGYVANANMQAASVLSRIVNVGRLGGMKGEFDFELHAVKRIDYIGVTFRTHSTEEIREINRRMSADLLPAVESGELRLPIDKAYPFAEADAACPVDSRLSRARPLVQRHGTGNAGRICADRRPARAPAAVSHN
jgi:hypothetical protein